MSPGTSPGTTTARPGFRTRLHECYRVDGGPLVWLGNFEVEQVWSRGATSLPRVSSREGSALVSRMDEFALWLATSDDVVLVKGDSDPDFVAYLAEITGETPSVVSLGAGTHEGLVSEAALAAARDGRLPDLPAGAAVAAHGFSAVEREFATEADLGWVGPDIGDVVEVNSKIYSRSLSDELGVTQPSGTTCNHLDDWDRAMDVARALLTNGPVVLKEAYGVSGKGLAVIESPDRLDRISRRIVRSAERNAGRVEFTIEQWARKDRDFNYQFTIGRDGRTTFDALQEIATRAGVHLGHRTPARLTSHQLDEIRDVADRVGARLHRDGYWGVVGVDALTDVDGTLYPIIEINARCNMSTYELPAQEAFCTAGQISVARHYEIRTDRSIPFSQVHDTLGDLLLGPGRTDGVVVLNHATLNAGGAVAAAGEPWLGRVYTLLYATDQARLDDVDQAATKAFASLSV